MEIIQTYMSDDTEICAISDGTTIHLVDKNDLSVENVAVGTKVRSSQMNEVYLEIPISELREMSRRSEIFVDPDEDEDETSDEEASDEEAEEEEPELPHWKNVAVDRFLTEYISLSDGLEVRVLAPVDMKISWDRSSDEEAEWAPADEDLETIEDLAIMQDTFCSQLRAFNRRIEVLQSRVQIFLNESEDYYVDMGDSIDVKDVFAVLADHKGKKMAPLEAAE